MIKNKLIILFTAILLVITFNIGLAQSVEYDVCCELANNGAQCVSVPSDECASNWAPTACGGAAVPSCQKGVCVSIESGECIENTPKLVCDNSGGLFKDKPIHQIPECKIGCCILGQDSLFSTEIACQETASKEGLSFSFRGDITNQNTCLGLSQLDEEGACVIKTQFETKCRRTTGSECGAEDSGSGFTSLLDKYVSGISVTTEFKAGMLCTADELDTDCVKSQKTTCYKDDIYYLDTCGNRANIFNSAKYPNPLNSDYWTNIREPLDICAPVSGGSSSAKTCGNCDYSSSTKCRSPQSGDPSPSNQQANFENICGDLRCEYKGETYQNTESWCAQTPGTPWQKDGPGIEAYLNGTLKTDKNELFNPTIYNLPGSRYLSLTCSEGEILPVECKDKREQVCKQYEQEGRTKAQCENNNPMSCFILEDPTKDKCNALPDCYWLSGSSPIIGGHADEGSVWSISKEEAEEQGLNAGRFPDDEREQKQGSCVPLFTPGNDFWTEQGQADCIGTQDFPRRVIYEISALKDRDEFGEDAETTGEKWSYGGKGGNYKRQSRCSGNCFAVPNFGLGVQDGLVKLWKGEKWNVNWGEGKKPVSDRQGQYCHKADKPSDPKSGQVSGDTVDCATDKDGAKRYNKPEFYTHSTWLKFIGIRARASGDCGVTTNFLGGDSSYDSEKITTVIQKVKQDQQEVKEKWKGDVVKGILYKGEDLKDLNAPTFRGSIYPGTSESVT